MEQKITVETTVHAPVEKVWECWTVPEHVTKWNHASDDWHSPSSTNDLTVGGTFLTRMESKDGAHGFDFSGTYTAVEQNKHLAYVMDDGRTVTVDFAPSGEACVVTETFDSETINSAELQKAGWQSILDNFKQYVESLT